MRVSVHEFRIDEKKDFLPGCLMSQPLGEPSTAQRVGALVTPKHDSPSEQTVSNEDVRNGRKMQSLRPMSIKEGMYMIPPLPRGTF